MLKLHFMLISMLAINMIYKKSTWWTTSISLIIMTFMITTSTTTSMSITSNLSSLDQLNQPLITLSILITTLMMMTSTKILHTNNNTKLFTLMSLSLLYILMSCFSASNIFLFYILFEASLVPTMIIIMLWGYQPERVQASMYMMMYTIAGSLPMLIMFLLMYMWSMSTHMFTMTMNFPINNSLFSMFLVMGFLVKLPMFMMHLWLPKAHVEAPIAGSMILAAILLKLGGYGIIRIMINTQHSTLNIQSLLVSISMIGAIMTSLVCLRQPDLKSLIAYSSVGHMGLMLAGAMSNSQWGLIGASMMMIAHGLSSSALFSLANLTYEDTHTRSMYLMKGLLSSAPIMSLWWFLFASANMAAPPSLNLMSEIMLITSISSMSLWAIPALMLITFLAGAYSLHMYSATQHGQLYNFMNPISHLKQKDMLMLLLHLAPLILLILKPELLSTWI